MARTGSGKTLAFGIPLYEKLLQSSSQQQRSGGTRAVILSPTRELSQQTLRVLQKFQLPNIQLTGIHGGESMERQFHALAKSPDVIVATPGRLAHHVAEIPDFSLSQCQMLILDEADRLLEMGFGSQIREICQSMPAALQKVLTSATLPKVLVDFSHSHQFLNDPTMVRLDHEARVSETLRMAFVTVRSSDKDAALVHLLERVIYPPNLESSENNNDEEDKRKQKKKRGLTIIFVATRHHVEYLSVLLQKSLTGLPKSTSNNNKRNSVIWYYYMLFKITTPTAILRLSLNKNINCKTRNIDKNNITNRRNKMK